MVFVSSLQMRDEKTEPLMIDMYWQETNPTLGSTLSRCTLQRNDLPRQWTLVESFRRAASSAALWDSPNRLGELGLALSNDSSMEFAFLIFPWFLARLGTSQECRFPSPSSTMALDHLYKSLWP